MADGEAKTALTKFVAVTDRVSQFEARVNIPTDPPPSVHTNKVRLQQIQALWDKVEKEYETCSEDLSLVNSTDTMEVFERCAATLNETIERASVQPIHEPPTPVPLPKCGNSLKHLKSTVQGCLTALKIAKVDITNWDYLLVFLCSSKLTKLTLALWEQSLLNPSEIPGEASAYVLPHLAGNLPSYTIPEGSLRDLPPIQLADPNFYQSSKIDVLIGADILPSIILGGFHSNVFGTLLGQETIFGWIICGPIAKNPTNRISSFSARLSVTESQLDGIVTKFLEVEDVPVKPGKESSSVCENNFQQTTTRGKEGWNEVRLNKNAPLREQYNSVIQEYLDLGHMHKVSPNDDSSNFYLPHHAVFKPDSTTTKVRVVFNASNKSSNGSSNGVFKYVFNADITKMYRQILVHSDHTRFQRILFRDKEGKLCDYELNTVTFGVNCATFLPYACFNNWFTIFMYVDDVLAGTHTQQSAVSAIKELRGALESAGFPLRKWTSNEKKLLQGIPKEHLIRADFLELEDASISKTLGIRWHATSDSFLFLPMDISLQTTYTKREVLSQIAKLFDPAGWLSPFIVREKKLLQEIWLRELSWDQPLPTDLVTKWRNFLEGYQTLKEVRIPRWVRFHPAAKLQFHGFCDALQSAYGAAIFVRVETTDGCFTHLLLSKTRVAPVKSLSIPRLELCGAVLLSELAAAVLSEMTPTQGVSVHELKDSNLWWHGPEWLRHNQEQWPLNSSVPLEIELEKRPIRCNVATAPPKNDILERFSAFERALRVLAYVFWFARMCRKQNVNIKAELTAAELSDVQERLIVLTQLNEYPIEYKALGKKQHIPVSSTISNLNPFIDSHGVLRASGRLRASEMLSYDEKHPSIIPARCTFAKLLALFTHRISLHGDIWIKLRNLVKDTIHSCRVCTIHRQKLQTQLMGDLPCARSTFSRAFTHTGVDFAGPFDIKNYVAFSRFSARRGCPHHIYSDNGKTFVGASTSLSKDFIEATRSLILSKYSLQNVTWHFNPPGAPHMGALWEAGVKSFKTHFYKQTAGGKYSFEELIVHDGANYNPARSATRNQRVQVPSLPRGARAEEMPTVPSAPGGEAAPRGPH
ncbi:uncharacterized protein LOC123038061 [Drosophila rhopaloa]|uniref:Integrase catalytic domain-containing protein n=1 Tax=Drosophila rhopaloa TaxID=1041015 RepID=A0ABM5JF62_DRORH|nr:uncharacterized protein LOC123038061 [Drosophila rhopaloa]